MPRYKSEKAASTTGDLVPHATPVFEGEPNPIKAEVGIYQTPIRVGSMACQIYYRAKAPASKSSRLTEVRRYFAGLIEIAHAQISPDGFRLSIADPETPIRVRDFKNEREAHAFLTDALTKLSPE